MKAIARHMNKAKVQQALISQNAQARVETLLLAMRQQQYETMAHSARLFLNVFPEEGAIWHLLGVACLMRDENTEAAKVLAVAVARLPQEAEVWTHLAVALNRTNRCLEAEQAYSQALMLNPNSADTWLNAAKNANDLERHAEGEMRSRKALQLEPGNPKALNNLGCALNGLKRFAEAETCLRESLRTDLNNPRTSITLGTALSEKAYEKCDDTGMEEAKRLLQQCVCALPTVSEGWNTLASTLFRLGELDEAISTYRKLLQVLKPTRNPQQYKYPSQNMPVHLAHKTLLHARSLLQGLGLKPFLVFGTLLGVHRQGDVLPFDKDVDLGLQWDVPRAPLKELMQDNGFNVVPPVPGENPLTCWNMGMRHEETGVALDIFFFKPEDNHLITGIMQRPAPILFKFPHFELQTRTWLGEIWHVPAPPEIFLESMYGKDWQIPDPAFDGLLSAHNLVPESVPASLCFGYARLTENLTRHNYPKARAYCRQILALQDDSVVREWAEWLATTDQCRAAASAQGGAA